MSLSEVTIAVLSSGRQFIMSKVFMSLRSAVSSPSTPETDRLDQRQLMLEVVVGTATDERLRGQFGELMASRVAS